ncbi:HalOD1 output domain-containing protein [Natranaeroarchaeum aerophilus]|uniref:Halobacterial output domain-containing protein n=1 Tax=Natranaeroarchaeum aerophilus TaxID=2917711 RepID=A0AAE3FQX5_9EURY|nr:HalOD1 output domain-containing protein [Natranaeroarchaeum aerophilus]MCL9814012.1 hypothetical protein [Natranaeroarchaeum aerophilus]
MTDTHSPQNEFDHESAVRYELDADTETSTAVIEAVAETAGCDPLDLEPLGTYVNPDALDALSTGSQGKLDATVSFLFGDHYVVVRSDGIILVHAD